MVYHPARISLLAWLVVSLLFMPSLEAKDGDPFRVESADFSLNKTVLELDASIEITLPSYISTAIKQGFAVPLMFMVEILSPQKYWMDETVLTLKQQYRLHYLPMLSSWVVFDSNSGQRDYFDSLGEAVQSLQVVDHYPMLDIDNVSDGRSFYARMRFGIDSDELPLPLKSSSLWDNDWGLTSEWFEWSIKKPANE